MFISEISEWQLSISPLFGSLNLTITCTFPNGDKSYLNSKAADREVIIFVLKVLILCPD